MYMFKKLREKKTIKQTKTLHAIYQPVILYMHSYPSCGIKIYEMEVPIRRW